MLRELMNDELQVKMQQSVHYDIQMDRQAEADNDLQNKNGKKSSKCCLPQVSG